MSIPHSNCFVSLPTTIVASLSELKPFASLIIIRLFKKAGTSSAAIYVACSGGTTPTQNQIVFHPNHAAALHLRQGDIVTATVAERISNYPRRCVDVAYLRPVSYDQCQTELSTSQPFQLASEQFSALNVTASFLETSVLSQMRLVYENLVVPIQLPAKECIYVRIMSMDTSGDQNWPYALLTASSQLAIEPPPTDPSRTHVKKVLSFFRALSMCRYELQRLSSLFQTHAILPADGSSDVRYAYVSRKDLESSNVAVPVAFICHEAIPKRHIWVPNHVCHALSLTPLTPLLVEEVSAFPHGDIDLFAEPCRLSDGLATFSELKEQRSVYFNSMFLRGLKVHIIAEPMLRADAHIGNFMWDTIGLKKPEHEDQDDIFNEPKNALLDDILCSEELMIAAKKRQMVNGFRSFPDQTMRLLDTKSSNVSSTGEKHRILLPPLLEDKKSAVKSLKSLSQSSKKIVHEVMKQARQHFRRGRTDRDYPLSITVEGALGTGKTHVCSAIASMLQDLALVRTVWVRCKLHFKDTTDVSITRIRSAFRGAVDGGPGLIVLDDIDRWIEIKQDIEKDKSEYSLKDIRGKRICVALERELRKKRAHPILVLFSCRDFKQLNKIIRCPGLIHSVLSISLPQKSDRALLIWYGLKQFGALDIHDGDQGEALKQQILDNLASLTDGFAPHDIRVALYRMQLKTKEKALPETILKSVADRLEAILKNMVPVNRIGIKITKVDPIEELSWKKIGGLSRAKRQLWEALQLPALHPDVFVDAPLRLPHGILLFGPPGCGKTMLAKTAALESNMRCIVVRGPELLSKYVGESEAEVRRAFDKAAQAAPCVLLFDEFDALAPRRGGYGTGVSDRVVNTFLACMDGADRLAEGVYVLATTSRPEVIDPALLRPGRLDKWIYLDVPATANVRLDILKCLYLNYFSKSNDAGAILELVAKKTDGYTGADLGSIINDAHMSVIRKGGSPDGTVDLEAIHAALLESLSESRPSLSRARRHAYERVMARFSACGEHGLHGGSFGELVPSRALVALK
ncbi:unnamed protein product [Agarophyton chilense]